MKIAVSASGRDLDSPVDARFGRCPCFLIVDTEDMSYKVVENESVALSGGAGIQAAQNVASEGADVVITGNCGPNAVRTLSAAGVEVIVGQSGPVKQAVEDYKDGKLEAVSEANVSAHYGSSGSGMGSGAGMGRGRMRFSDAGTQKKAGQSTGDPSMTGSDQKRGEPRSETSEFRGLKDEIETLRRQVREIETRLSGLETGKD